MPSTAPPPTPASPARPAATAAVRPSEPRPSGVLLEDARAALDDELRRHHQRRRFLQQALAGTVVAAFAGGVYRIAHATPDLPPRPDGRPRVPPGQRLLEQWRPMGGEEGPQGAARFRLKVHGEVERPFELDFKGLLALPQVETRADVHCVTGWTVLDALVKGVQVKALAERAGVKRGVRAVIFEAAHGYTANVPLAEALAPSVMVIHRAHGAALKREHGAPVRALVPDLYFWKSAKWLTGVRFSRRDEPGYWETRGYHNHADPWKEERYS